MSARITRSRSRHLDGNETDKATAAITPQDQQSTHLRLKAKTPKCTFLDDTELLKRLSKLPSDDLSLLRLKQRKLRQPNAQVPSFIERSNGSNEPSLAQAAAATLVFAWEAAGTAICISSGGLLLTCSHCVAETEEEYVPAKLRWLLFASGDAVQAECVAWDPRRDLALLQITAASASCTSFPHIDISTAPSKLNTPLLCIGHPGSEDLEASQAGIETNYDVLHISEGRFRGLAEDQDVQDNSEIGALMHDCWTYWGHSGAPLVGRNNGRLIGLHSSWDDETGMRRGIAWEAVRDFLEEHTTSHNR